MLFGQQTGSRQVWDIENNDFINESGKRESTKCLRKLVNFNFCIDNLESFSYYLDPAFLMPGNIDNLSVLVDFYEVPVRQNLYWPLLFAHLAWHLAFVNILTQIFSSETTEWIQMTLCMVVAQRILHKDFASIFDLLRNMAAVTKNRTYWSDRRFTHISQKLLT